MVKMRHLLTGPPLPPRLRVLSSAMLGQLRQGVGRSDHLWPCATDPVRILNWYDEQLARAGQPYGFWAAQVLCVPFEQPAQKLTYALTCRQDWGELRPCLLPYLQQWTPEQPVRTVVIAFGTALATLIR
jgi:hypothetical protein